MSFRTQPSSDQVTQTKGVQISHPHLFPTQLTCHPVQPGWEAVEREAPETWLGPGNW